MLLTVVGGGSWRTGSVERQRSGRGFGADLFFIIHVARGGVDLDVWNGYIFGVGRTFVGDGRLGGAGLRGGCRGQLVGFVGQAEGGKVGVFERRGGRRGRDGCLEGHRDRCARRRPGQDPRWRRRARQETTARRTAGAVSTVPAVPLAPAVSRRRLVDPAASTRPVLLPLSPLSALSSTTTAALASRLGRLLVLPVHRHRLAGEDVGESAFVAEFAVSFYEPGAGLLVLAGFEDRVGKGAGRAGCARAYFEELAGDMGQVFRCSSALGGERVRQTGNKARTFRRGRL